MKGRCTTIFTLCCVCFFFPFILDIKFVGRTSRGHQEEGHTGFLIRLLSAVRALIFLARRIQPFLSLVDREVVFLCTKDLIVLHSLGIFIFIFIFSEKNPVYPGSNSRPNRVRRLRGYLGAAGATGISYKYKPILLCTQNVFVLFLSGVPAWRLMYYGKCTA